MKILHLEDNRRDAALVRAVLESEWPYVDIHVVSAREQFVAELAAGGYDVILSDISLPAFRGDEALGLTRERRPEIPFIFLSGTVGEDTAVAIVRAGAADYLLKDRMQRLPLAIQRALHDNGERKHHLAAQERIREQAELLDKTRDGIVATDPAPRAE